MSIYGWCTQNFNSCQTLTLRLDPFAVVGVHRKIDYNNLVLHTVGVEAEPRNRKGTGPWHLMANAIRTLQ